MRDNLVSFRCSPELVALIEEQSKAKDISFSAAARQLIRGGLDDELTASQQQTLRNALQQEN